MRPDERDPAHLWDMLEAAMAIARYGRGKTIDEYLRDPMFRDAVERQFILVGEAARRLTEAFRAAHPEIPWQGVIGQRNVLIHRYEEIDDRLMWERIQRDVPDLIRLLSPLIPNPPVVESES